MSCDQYTDSVELYAIGCLEKPEADALCLHLESGCAECNAQLDLAIVQAAFISGAIPQVEPPASLKERIAASVRNRLSLVVMPERKRSMWSLAPWLIAAASIAALVIGIGYEEKARRSEAAALSASIEETTNANAERTAAMLSILQAPGTTQVALDLTKANLPHGSLFIHKNLGVAMVIARLPTAPEGWKYESWVVPKAGAPRPIESFAIDKTGLAFTVVKGPVDVTQWAAMAVSLEPKDSTPVKPTKVVFASPV